MSKSELQNRMTLLSIPSTRRMKFKWSMEKDDYAERRAKMLAQMAVPSPIVVKLARRKSLPEEAKKDLEFKPFKVKKAALNYKATTRIKDLAVPVKKKERVQSDVKDDPFKVLPRALRAKPTKNQDRLAQPKVITEVEVRTTRKKLK